MARNSKQTWLDKFSYDPISGNIYVRNTRYRTHLNKPMGSLSSHGYVYLKLNGERRAAHRVAWLLMTGEWPSDQIDHINRIRADNRWANLRDVDATANLLNREVSLLAGVFPHNQGYKAQIGHQGRTVYLGHFQHAEDAADAYREARLNLKGA